MDSDKKMMHHLKLMSIFLPLRISVHNRFFSFPAIFSILLIV